MVFSVVDARGLILAGLAGAGVVMLPGLALARLFGFSLLRNGIADLLSATVIGLTVLPVLDSLVTRCMGLDVTAVLTLGLAATGVILLLDKGRKGYPSGTAVCLLAAWAVLLLLEWIDYDIGGRLYQPLTVIDTVKHAVTTQAILDSGAPPRDAFFLRPERSSYYYFFYTLSALIERVSFGLVDAKAAVGGLVFWVGIGLYGLVRLAMSRIGVEISTSQKTLPLVVTAVLAISGFDILAVVFIAMREGYWMADPMQWNAQVSIWSGSVLWVPHHVTALIAGTLGLVALSDLADERRATSLRVARNVLLAALAFAASLGLSVWVTLALVTTAAVWGLVLLVERQWRAVLMLGCAGLLAMLFGLPQILDLCVGRSGPLPIISEVREFAPVDALLPVGIWRTLGRAVTLPINYLIEFGAVAIGSVMFWLHRRQDIRPLNGFARILTIAAASGLLLGSLFRSLIFNNDLGWRVVLYPLFAGTVWTIMTTVRLLQGAGRPTSIGRVLPALLLGGAAVGWATSIAILFSMRAYPILPVDPAMRYVASDTQTEWALRVAYTWAGAHLPRAHVLQHNPSRPRALAFGLYSTNPTALSDRYGSLYGADLTAVATRLAALTPIYKDPLSEAAIRAIASRCGIDDLVVTAADPVWARKGSFVWRAKPLFASERVRIIPVNALGG